MRPRDGSPAPDSAALDGPGPEPDRVSALAARVDEIDSLLRAASGIVDERTLKELRRTIDALSKRDPKFEERLSNKVDVMADRVETVSKTVSTSSAALVAKEGEIAQLRRELEVALARVGAATSSPTPGASAGELAELKREVDALAQLTKQKLPRGLESRVAELSDKFTLLAQRVDSVSTTISTTAAGLAGRDGDVTALRKAVETERDRVAGELAALQRAVDLRPVDELRQALKEHTDETGRQQHSIRQLVAKTGASVDALAARLESLTASVTTTTGRVSEAETGLAAFRTYFEDAGKQLSAHIAQHQRALAALSAGAAAREQADAETMRVLDEREAGMADRLEELAGRLDGFGETLTETASRAAGSEETMSVLRAYVDDAGERLGALLADQKRSLAALSSRAAALEEADAEVVRRLDERLSAEGGRIDELAARLDPLSAAVATTSEHVAARDVELQSLEDRFRQASSRVDALVTDLSQALAEFPDPKALTRALDGRLDEHADLISTYADRLSRMEATVSEELRNGASTSEELERGLAETRATASDQSERLATLTASVAAMSTRVDATRAVDEHVAGMADRLDELAGRLDGFGDALTDAASRAAGGEESMSALRAYVDDAGERLGALLAEQKRSLAALSSRAAALEEADADVARRLDERSAAEGGRIDELAASVEAAAARLSAKEDELASLHRHFTESSARIESIVDDIRVALSALPDVGSVTADDLAAHVERTRADVSSLDERMAQLEVGTRDAANALDRRKGELQSRMDEIDQRLAIVAEELSRAKTLWPVALRSLEARLDDAVQARRPSEQAAREGAAMETGATAPSEDLLTGLRDSLHAMETVAAEMARASDALESSPDESAEPGATIVPLRTGEP